MPISNLHSILALHYGYNRMKLRNGQVETFGGTIYFAVDGTLFTGLIIYMGISSQGCIFTGIYYLQGYIIFEGVLFTGQYDLKG